MKVLLRAAAAQMLAVWISDTWLGYLILTLGAPAVPPLLLQVHFLSTASFRPRLSLDVVFRPADSVLWCIHHTTQMIAWAREVCSADLVPLGLRPHSVYSCQHIHSSQWTICVPGLCQCCFLTQWYQPTPSFFFLNQCFSISISFADSYEVKKKKSSHYESSVSGWIEVGIKPSAEPM